MIYIYVLKNPLTKEIRYVGKTTNTKIRLYNHIHLVNRGRTHCKSWIKSLLSQNLEPEMEIIEECNTLVLSSLRERFWIDYYKDNNLCNHTIGGECGKLSQEHIKSREKQVLLALDLIRQGKKPGMAEKEAGLFSSYLYRVRKGEIDFLKHIHIPYFRNLKRLKTI